MIIEGIDRAGERLGLLIFASGYYSCWGLVEKYMCWSLNKLGNSLNRSRCVNFFSYYLFYSHLTYIYTLNLTGIHLNL